MSSAASLLLLDRPIVNKWCFIVSRKTPWDPICHMNTPSEQLLKEVRAEPVRRGTSLKASCEKHCYGRQAVGMAISGKRSGPKSRALADRFIHSTDRSK
jgi:hypothetical protein